MAGEYDQSFADLLARTPRGEMVSGLVMVDQQVDIPQMQRRVSRLGLTSRWRQHEYAVREAQDLASRTQVGLIQSLEQWKSEGLVRSYQPFWVTNMIAVEAGADAFDRLLARSDVGTIFENAEVQIRSTTPEEGLPPANPLLTLPDNLICINVEPAWNIGLKGQGRLVADFDTGADGTHPALAPRWRGSQPGVNWWEAWKDPYNQSEFPYDSGIHGTHTLGIMIGEKPDHTPFGVAPGAQWIAAGVLINWNVQKIIECYQWAIDPDGDPGTIDDVPDVINNSWGTSANCDQSFWNAIDLVEAAGIVNTIAVDNSGPGYASVNSPESRALSPTVNFGVGNVDPHTAGYPIANTSGRGPSPCDFSSIKPEVTAPGTSINSTIPGGSYGNMTGTSMACPHVSGAVAILRQLNPDISVDDVKTALMATAFDRGDAGEDNTYGWGIIDVGAAVQYVRSRLPNVPPTDLIATVAGDSVTLEWTRPDPINPYNPLLKYRIYRAPVGEPYPLDPIAEMGGLTSVLRYVDPGLANGSYKYVITAKYLQGESGPSNEVAVDILLAAPPPLNLTASAAADSVGLSWERPVGIHPHNLLLSYRLYRAPANEPFGGTPLAEFSDTAAVVSYLDAPAPHEILHYVVRGVYQRGEGDPSNEVEVDATIPAPPPLNLTASVVADTVNLSWHRPAGVEPVNPLLSYRLYRAPAGEPFPEQPLAEFADTAAVVTYMDPAVPVGAYHYVVRGGYQRAEGEPSNEVQLDIVLPAPPPANLAATAVPDTVSLSWERPVGIHPHNLLVSYRLYRAPEGEPFPGEPLVEFSDTSAVVFYLDAAIPPFTVLHYIVRGHYQQTAGDPSNEAVIDPRDPADVADGVSSGRASLEISPNPFNPVTVIRYQTANRGGVTIRVFGADGSLVRAWEENASSGGVRSIVWDGTGDGGRPIASGIYFVRMEGPGANLSRRVTLLK
jgi:subtilisin family serine protease